MSVTERKIVPKVNCVWNKNELSSKRLCDTYWESMSPSVPAFLLTLSFSKGKQKTCNGSIISSVGLLVCLLVC